MTKPIIGITAFSAYYKEIKDYCGLSYDYINAVQKAGGIPWLITPWETEVEQITASIDGLLLTGGIDINPKLYGQQPHPKIDKIDDKRDHVELAFLKQAIKNTLPIFGVCRGCQLINVLQGGSLFQHIFDMPNQIDHRVPPKLTQSHEVSINPECQLAGIYEEVTTQAISWHHQAIDALGDGLIVTAKAEDGIIEAIEMPAYEGWLIGVQYHPESCPDEYPQQAKLFRAFVDACGLADAL